MSPPIRVNIDYEETLFYDKSPSPTINQSLEFLAFFLDGSELWTNKQYSKDYLDYVESLVGQSPRTTHQGLAINWWGPLLNKKNEQWLNSKETSAALNRQKGWDSSYTIDNLSQLADFDWEKDYIAKNPYGMSGQKFHKLASLQSIEEKREWIEKALKHGPLILEPLLNRKYDFSHYIFPNGKVICYENVVDEKFQYRGTVFSDHHLATVPHLSFYHLLQREQWRSLEKAIDEIKAFYPLSQDSFGFSIDSFIYEEQGLYKIRYLSEVNHRRTMGRVTYDLAQKFAQKNSWVMLVMGKSYEQHGGFRAVQSLLKDELFQEGKSEGVIILSPGDVRFELFFLCAANPVRGQALFERVRKLLPHSQFSVEF